MKARHPERAIDDLLHNLAAFEGVGVDHHIVALWIPSRVYRDMSRASTLVDPESHHVAGKQLLVQCLQSIARFRHQEILDAVKEHIAIRRAFVIPQRFRNFVRIAKIDSSAGKQSNAIDSSFTAPLMQERDIQILPQRI